MPSLLKRRLRAEDIKNRQDEMSHFSDSQPLLSKRHGQQQQPIYEPKSSLEAFIMNYPAIPLIIVVFILYALVRLITG